MQLRAFGLSHLGTLSPFKESVALPQAYGVELSLFLWGGGLVHPKKITVFEVIHPRGQRTKPDVMFDLVNLALVHFALGSRIEERLPIAFPPSSIKTDRLNKLAWLEFRHIVTVMGRLMVNLTDFNAVHFGPSSLRHRKSAAKASKAAAEARKRKAKDRKKATP